ncbi:MAG: hypothetical protein RL062_1506 [Bacteroidota bacterium]|jgi:hypothetical protein
MLSLFFVLFASQSIFAQGSTPPIESNGYTAWTSHSDMKLWLERLSEIYTVEMRLLRGKKEADIPVVIIPAVQNDAMSVMVIAEQHGDEPSGMEASLHLISDLLNGQLATWTDSVQWIIVPMVNPEGHELKSRRKKNGADLNRDHLTLSEPETQYLHQIYNKYHPDVFIDVHEIPFVRATNEQRYERRIQEQVGYTTNLNLVDSTLNRIIHTSIFPFVEEKLKSKNISFTECTFGNASAGESVRYSSVDIDDARQGIGAMGKSLSFLVEGLNGKNRNDSIFYRVQAQYECIKILSLACYRNRSSIQERVASNRVRAFYLPENVAIKMKYVSDGTSCDFPFINRWNGKDTIFHLTDAFLNTVVTDMSIETPLGYWIPKDDKKLVDWVEAHEKGLFPFEKMEQLKGGAEVKHMAVQMVATVPVWSTEEREGITVPQWKVEWTDVQNWKEKDYIFVSTNTINGLRWVMALEPESMFALVRYPQFAYLRNHYPILRVISR